MNRIKAAIFGTGFIGRVHLDAVRRLASVELAALVDPNIDAARQLGAGFAIPRSWWITGRFSAIQTSIPFTSVRPTRSIFPWPRKRSRPANMWPVKSRWPPPSKKLRNLWPWPLRPDYGIVSATTCATTPWCSRYAACAKPATWERSSLCRAPIRRTGYSTIRTGTGASTPRSAAFHDAWPT